jgi:hypothetical protein
MDADADDPRPNGRTARSSDGPGDETLPSGWVPLVRNHWLTELMATGSWILVWVLLSVWIATNNFLGDLAGQGVVVVWLGAVLGVLLAIVLWYRFRPLPTVNFDKNLFRTGLRTVSISKITWALVDSTWTRSRAITLQFGTGTLLDESDFARRALAVYVVRTVRGETPPLDRARFMAEVLRRSNIALPEPPEDPLGNSTIDFTGTVTRDKAVDIVLNPPTLNDPRTGAAVPQ